MTVGAIFDPPSGHKVLNRLNLPEFEWQMVWINNSNNATINTQIFDAIPNGTTYVANSLVCQARGTSVTTTCMFDSGNNWIFWQGSIGPDLGANTAATANNEVVITFRVDKHPRVVLVRNAGASLTDTDGDGDFQDETPVSVSRTNEVVWKLPAPAPSLSPAGLVVAIGLLALIARGRLRRTAGRP